MYNRICTRIESPPNASPLPLQANLERQGLPEKTLARLHDLLPQEHVVAPDPGGSDHLHLHLGDVAADAGARAVAEGNEGVLLPRREGRPALGPKLVGVGTPDIPRVVDRV